jgi:tetratricopeptide (TPR) repeat protein
MIAVERFLIPQGSQPMGFHFQGVGKRVRRWKKRRIERWPPRDTPVSTGSQVICMKCIWFLRVAWAIGLGLIVYVTPVHGQAGPPEQIQRSLLRAETAWRNRTSLLEAKVRVDQVLEEAPNHADALKLRAEVLIAMQRYQEALVDAQRATEINPRDGAAYLILAEAARLNDDFDLARHSLERAAALAIEESADFHIRLSRSAMLLGEDDLDMAESYARVALAKDRNFAGAYYQLARIFLLKNRAEDAVSTLVRGFQAELLDPIYLENDSTLQILKDHQQIIEFMQ